MVAQKKMRKNSSDLVKIKELLAEMQIYVQKHHLAIQQELIDETKLKVSVESLRNEMEIRYELALKQFYDKLKMQMTNFVEKEDLNNRLYEKLHKREFEKHFDRLNSTCSYLETKISNAIPAMKYDLDTRLKGKAEQRDLDQLGDEKASNVTVQELVSRVNRLQDKIDRRHGDDSGSESGSNQGGGRDDKAIAEESMEDSENSEQEERRRERKAAKNKILKGSPSVEELNKNKSN